MKHIPVPLTMNPNKYRFMLLLGISLLFAAPLRAQAPEAINYQAIARDTSGQVLASQGLTVITAVYSGPLGDTLVYQEDHIVSTNAYGLFTLRIGEGTPATGTFASIKWELADHFLEVSLDPGTGAVNLGKRRFNTVPYSQYAPVAGKAVAMSLADLSDVDTTGALAGDVLKWDGTQWAPGIDLIAPGIPGVELSPRLTGDGTSADPLDIAQQGATLNQVLTWNGSAWVPQTDADSDPTNEIQSLLLSGNTLALSNGGGSVNLPAYTAGFGISITGNTISNTGDTNANDDITIASSAGGDVAGTFSALTVAGIQGYPVSNGAPLAGQALVWNGSQWVPSAIPNNNLWSQNAPNLYYNTGNVSIGTNASVTALSVAGTTSVLDATNQVRVESGVINGAGYVQTFGDNGTTNTALSNRAGSVNNGFVAVYDSTGALKAGIVVNAAGDGEIFGDVKNFRVEHPLQPEKEIWYASLEGPEAAAYARGTATLVEGRAIIEFPEHYRLIAQEVGMTVMLTPLSGESQGLAVVKKGKEGFEVQELMRGKGNYAFDWEVKSVRRGHEQFEVVRKRMGK